MNRFLSRVRGLPLVHDLVQYAVEVGNGHSVVRHGNLLRTRPVDAAKYVFPIEHTGATVDNQMVWG